MDQGNKELLIGCGNDRKRLFGEEGQKGWGNLVTLDIDPGCSPDVIHDLNFLPYPFDDNEFNEIHAYDVLEHCGKQGDWNFFFAQFTEFWRILKPDGLLCALVPHWGSLWSFGDPGHTRIINDGTLVFLSQKQYSSQIGERQMTDYRHVYKADFDIVMSEYNGDKYLFALQAKKEE